jgi:ketosteroid isomerase-like protein
MRWSTILLVAACHRGLVRPPDSEAILRRQTQEMMDAITTGDASAWTRYVDPDVIYVSEGGVNETKASLVKQVEPLPAGISGTIKAEQFEIRFFGDVAIVRHVDDEHELFFGHAIHAQYLTTATWRYGKDGWRMIAGQVLAMLIDPPAVTLPPAELDDYVGSYRLNETVTYVISRDGDTLVGLRTGGKPQPLRVEVKDVLFVPGQPRSRKIFRRDLAGRVMQLVDRREGRDVVWSREN